MSSPCKSSGICIPIGGGVTFTCICPSGCTAYDCSYCPSTVIPATTTPTPGTCTDFNSNLCAYYANKGLCLNNAYINGVPILISCPRSCNFCNGGGGVTNAPTCVDTQANCCLWKNLCYRLAGYSPHPCPATCGLC